MIIAKGLDGVLYRLRKISDGFLQRKKSDKDFTEPKNKRLISQLIYVKAK